MTAPIDLPCPRCKATAGRWCIEDTMLSETHSVSREVSYYHGQRVDAAARELARQLRSDPGRLRTVLREALERYETVGAWIALVRRELDL